MNATRTLIVLLATVLTLTVGSAAHAALIAYDGFEAGGAAPGTGQYNTSGYTADVLAADNLVDRGNISVSQGPDLTGFSSSDQWAGGGAGTGDFAEWIYFKTEEGGLTYDGLVTTPGQLRHFRTSGSAGTKTVTRDATTTDVGQKQWISFLLNADQAFSTNEDSFSVEMRWDIVDGTNLAGGRPLAFSIDGDGNVSVEPTVDVTGNESIDVSGSGITTDETHLFVFEISGDLYTDGDFGNGRLYDEYTLYVDPDLSQGEAGLATSSAQVLTGRGIFRDNVFGALDDTRAPFGSLTLTGELDTPSDVIFDEFRIGMTFADVTPGVVPEPMTGGLALMGLAGLGLAMRRRRQLSVVAIALMVGVVGFASERAEATILVSEDFDAYSAGAALSGLNGGSGWTGAWSGVSGVTVEAEALAAAGVSGAPNAAKVAGVNNNSVANRAFSPISTGDPFYLSLLFEVDGFSGNDFELFQLTDGGTGNTTQSLGVGIKDGFVSARAGSSSNATVSTGITPVNNQSYLLVAKVSKALNGEFEKVEVFVDPTDPTEPTPDATASHPAPDMTQLSLFSVRTANLENTDVLLYDEIRITDNWADAIHFTPVPEPMTAGLAAMSLGALGMGLRRRRAA